MIEFPLGLVSLDNPRSNAGARLLKRNWVGNQCTTGARVPVH